MLDESTILRLRHLLENKLAPQMLASVNAPLRSEGLPMKAGTVVDPPKISAPSSMKNAISAREPRLHQRKKGSQWYFGMKAHVGVDA